MAEDGLPEPLRAALAHLRADGFPEVKVDAVADNWAYVWLPQLHFDQAKYPEPERRGVWIRLPIQFPFANPHGMVTKEPLNPKDGHAVPGHNPNHDMCRPVGSLGGAHYYSWSWGAGPLGEAPSLSAPTDITKVVAWYERRIRLA